MGSSCLADKHLGAAKRHVHKSRQRNTMSAAHAVLIHSTHWLLAPGGPPAKTVLLQATAAAASVTVAPLHMLFYIIGVSVTTTNCLQLQKHCWDA
jgi:hypothetical protein